MFSHGGSGSGYANYGCRCEPCTTAHRLRVRRRREERKAKGVPEGVQHGVSAYINWCCRCPVCTEEHSRACRERRQRRLAREQEAS